MIATNRLDWPSRALALTTAWAAIDLDGGLVGGARARVAAR
jgi:hypothetical protein